MHARAPVQNEILAVKNLVYDPVSGSIRTPDEDEVLPDRSSRSTSFSGRGSNLFRNTTSFFSNNQEVAKATSKVTAFNIETRKFGLTDGATFSFRTGPATPKPRTVPP